MKIWCDTRDRLNSSCTNRPLTIPRQNTMRQGGGLHRPFTCSWPSPQDHGMPLRSVQVQGCGLLVQTNRGPGYAYSYPLLVSLAAPSYLKLCLLDDVLIPPSREQIRSPVCLPHLQPSAPPLSPGPTPVYANRTPKHGASRHTRQSPHPRRELAAAIPTTSFYLRVRRHRTLRCWLLPLRLPHPVASHAPGPHDVAKCCQCPSNTTTPSPLDRLPRLALNSTTFAGRLTRPATIYARQLLLSPPVL